MDGHILRGTCLTIGHVYICTSQATNPHGHTFRDTGTHLLSGYTFVDTQGPTRDIVLTHFYALRVPGIMSTCPLCGFSHSPNANTCRPSPTRPQSSPVAPITDLKATLFSLGLYFHESQNLNAETHTCVHALNAFHDIIKHIHIDKHLFTQAQGVTGHTPHHNYSDIFPLVCYTHTSTMTRLYTQHTAGYSRLFTLIVRHAWATRVSNALPSQ